MNAIQAAKVGILDQLAAELVRIDFPYRLALKEFRKAYLSAVLVQCKWNACNAAQRLGMHRNTVSREMEALGIERPERRKPPNPAQLARERVWARE